MTICSAIPKSKSPGKCPILSPSISQRFLKAETFPDPIGGVSNRLGLSRSLQKCENIISSVCYSNYFLVLRLATLLEGAGYFLFSSAISDQTFILLWWKEAVELECEHLLCIVNMSTIDGSEKVTLPRCSSVGASTCSWPTKKNYFLVRFLQI